MKRVVVTGIGVVSPVGCALDEFWRAVVEGRSGIGPFVVARSERLTTQIAAQAREFDPAAHFEGKQQGLLDRFSQFAVVAARAAISDSGLTISEPLALEAATVIGSAAGGQTTMDNSYFKLYAENAARLHPLTVPRLMTSAAASQISMDLGLKGPAFCVASACASGAHAIGLAFQMIRSGQTSVAVAGGAEACLTTGTIKAWESLVSSARTTAGPSRAPGQGWCSAKGLPCCCWRSARRPSRVARASTQKFKDSA